MTVVAALSRNGQTSIGSNTGYTIANDSVVDHGLSPWVLFQDWALGFTGSMLALNVCRAGLVKHKDKLVSEGDVITEVGRILSDYDIGVKSNAEPIWSYGIWCVLVHGDGRIWDVDESLSLGIIPKGMFWARGSGEKYALGAAHSLLMHDSKITTHKLMHHAIASSIHNDIYCPGSVYVYDVK